MHPPALAHPAEPPASLSPDPAPFGTENHSRGNQGENLVYPVMSRRSGGLSVGINLFPGSRVCTFACPYCEVSPQAPVPLPGTHPSQNPQTPLLARLQEELDEFAGTWEKRWSPLGPVRDLCISGNGEPTISPDLPECLRLLVRFRNQNPEITGSTPIVVITNGTGLLADTSRSRLLQVLGELSPQPGTGQGIEFWVKIDAVSQSWFSRISGSSFDPQSLRSALHRFSLSADVRIQTMLCRLDGIPTPEPEALSIAREVRSLSDTGGRILSHQLYTLARPPADERVTAFTDNEMLAYASLMTPILGSKIPLSVYGRTVRIQ